MRISLRFHYNILFLFGLFGGFFGNCLFGGFASSNTVFLFLVEVVNAIDEATDANNEHVGAEEADEGGNFEIASIQDDETHDGTTNTNGDADETVGLVFGSYEAVDDIDETGNGGVDSESDCAISNVVVGEAEQAERGDDVNEWVDDGVNPTTFFGGIVKRASSINDAHREQENAK